MITSWWRTMSRSGNLASLSVLATLAILAALMASAVHAQSTSEEGSYPNRPVRLIIPWPPSGSNDILGRLLAQKLSESLGQVVVVDNRAGAGGIIGQELGARAAPNGYTLTLATSGTMAITPFVVAKPGYDPLKSYELVTLFAVVPYMMVAHASVQAKDAREFIAYAKARPDALNMASTGTGSINHLAGELFNLLAGTRMVHVPYKGGGPAVADLLAGHVHVYFTSVASMMPFIKAGKVRPLGMGTLKRASELPDLATLDEQGLKGYDVVSWAGIVAPAGTPVAIVKRLHADIAKIMAGSDMRERLLTHGAEPVAIGLEDFRVYLNAELQRWGPLVKQVGIKAE
jgi:tripartite-type tricarboxylate transporter receptor subunit TctC